MCKECECFHSIPETEGDFEQGMGDCVMAVKDNKGKYWHDKKVKEESNCAEFKLKQN
ncbi:MAG: benzylsuccinate synthase gamma subunit family protein [Desulfitobacteriaceae bacterium]